MWVHWLSLCFQVLCSHIFYSEHCFVSSQSSRWLSTAIEGTERRTDYCYLYTVIACFGIECWKAFFFEFLITRALSVGNTGSAECRALGLNALVIAYRLWLGCNDFLWFPQNCLQYIDIHWSEYLVGNLRLWRAGTLKNYRVLCDEHLWVGE